MEDEMCSCGHSKSEHRDAAYVLSGAIETGGGICRMCNCDKFTFVSFIAETDGTTEGDLKRILQIVPQDSTKNLTRLILGDTVVWYSYSTPIAVWTAADRIAYATEKRYSPTTDRHIGIIKAEFVTEIISDEDFGAYLRKAMRAGIKHVIEMAEEVL